MRWQGKNFGLTYSQVTEFTRKELYDELSKQKNLEYLCVSEERHADGGTHFHVHIQYTKRKDIKNPNYFDFKGKHCSIETLVEPDAWNTYIKKDNNYEENQDYDKAEFDPFEFGRNNDYESFLKECMKKKISAQYASMIWSHINAVCYEVTEDSSIEGTMSPMLSIVDIKMPRKSYLLIGPTGCGKTTYAKKHCSKPALFVSHIDQLKQFNPRKHKSIIFDDMDFSHWPVTGQIAITDQDDDRAINVKHSVAFIPKNTEKWFTCNRMPFSDFAEIKRRLNIINLY